MSRRYTGPWWVYILVDPRDGHPFYVGMTCNPLGRWRGHCTDWGSSAKPRLDEIRRLGLKCRVRVMGEYSDKEAAKDRERLLVERYQDIVVSSVWTPRFGASISATLQAKFRKNF